MEMAFPMRSRLMLDQSSPARLDHELLQATLAAGRATKARSPQNCCFEDSLIELVIAGAGWRQAAMRQRGCFNRAEAGRGRNGA